MDEHISSTGDKILTKTIKINAPISMVWDALTNPDLMKKWMSESEIEIITDWQVGNPFLIRGKLHGIKFENTGRVLQFEPGKLLEYSHLSSLSRLPDKPENYSVIAFSIAPSEDQTTLTLTASNFPTETIYKHVAFYWNVTPEILKRMLESEG